MTDMINKRMAQTRVLRLANRIYHGRLLDLSWYVSTDVTRIQRVCKNAVSMETSTHNNPEKMNLRFLNEAGRIILDCCFTVSEFWVLLDLDQDVE
jgi:hypothetical protein